MQRLFRKHAPDWILESYLEGRKALDRIPESRPNAVLMDLVMPDISGVDCTKILKTQFPRLPIVILSGHVETGILLRSMMAGACGCFYKPATAAEIVLGLKKAMAGTMAFCPRAEKSMLACFSILGKTSEAGNCRDGKETY